jgi:hypothetical protein
MEVNRVSAITNAEYKKQKTTLFVESRNAKRLWAQHFGFRGSGFGDYKCQTPTHNNSRIMKMRMEYGPSTSGFRGSGFRGLRIPNATNNNSRIAKKKMECGPSPFWVSGFTNSRCKTPHNVKRRIMKSRKRCGAQPISGFDIW